MQTAVCVCTSCVRKCVQYMSASERAFIRLNHMGVDNADIIQAIIYTHHYWLLPCLCYSIHRRNPCTCINTQTHTGRKKLKKTCSIEGSSVQQKKKNWLWISWQLCTPSSHTPKRKPNTNPIGQGFSNFFNISRFPLNSDSIRSELQTCMTQCRPPWSRG